VARFFGTWPVGELFTGFKWRWCPTAEVTRVSVLASVGVRLQLIELMQVGEKDVLGCQVAVSETEASPIEAVVREPDQP
jgi:hypothetical protein